VSMLSDGQVVPERAARRLFVVVAVLVAVGLVEAELWTRFGYSARGLSSRFDLASDTSVPTFFSSAVLTVAALLTLLVARDESRPRDRLLWRLLAVILVGMAIDEVARFHEWLGDATDVGGDGFFYYTWVYFGIALVVGVGAVFLPFVLRQPRRLRNLIVASAALFVGGALLMEMVNANLESSVDAETAERWAEFGTDSFRYAMQTTVEELFEMVGVVVFVYALLDELRRRNVAWVVTIGRRRERAVGDPVRSGRGGADAASPR
jgi:Heparan-alpha-glucosaminide N-acetyltransferase, catalytic